MTITGEFRPRVLVFDDSELVRLAMHSFLEQKGFDVLSYPSPALCPLRCLERCKCEDAEYCADAIITDLEMPHVEGLAFLEELAAKACKVHRIALLTGHSATETVEHARKLGCRVFIKPEGITDLLHWLDEEMAHLDAERHLLPRGKL
jgi:DNA-binding NarL/FixJ family response regulator